MSVHFSLFFPFIFVWLFLFSCSLVLSPLSLSFFVTMPLNIFISISLYSYMPLSNCIDNNTFVRISLHSYLFIPFIPFSAFCPCLYFSLSITVCPFGSLTLYLSVGLFILLWLSFYFFPVTMTLVQSYQSYSCLIPEFFLSSPYISAFVSSLHIHKSNASFRKKIFSF